jgi:DNA-binding NtrC family response regulator
VLVVVTAQSQVYINRLHLLLRVPPAILYSSIYAPKICEESQTVGSGQILIVDDDESILSAFTRILKRSGYNTDNAKSAEETLAKLDCATYDIALVDLQISEVDRAHLLKKMSKKDHGMIKVLITDFPDSRTRQGAMEGDVVAYVKKPVKPERLLKLIGRKLEIKRARMQS